MTKNDDKYGDLDTLLSTDNTQAIPDRQQRRPSPSIAVTLGDNRTTSVTDKLKAKNSLLESELAADREAFRIEKASLEKKLASMKVNASTTPYFVTMPVTKTKVSFTLETIDSSLIDVSPENERIQDLLDEISLQDILPSLNVDGQQKPGTVRPKKNGRYELIEGSRRLACCKLLNVQYLALVGDVPDADVRSLSVIENKHQDVSPYEKAKAYERQIKNGEFKNWSQLGASKGISTSHISRYKLCAELDEIFVKILPSASDMPLSYGETISLLRNKDENSLFQEGNRILSLRDNALGSQTEPLDTDTIIKLLRSSVRVKKRTLKPVKPITYKSKVDSSIQLKHSTTTSGSSKFELVGASEDDLRRVIEALAKSLKLDL